MSVQAFDDGTPSRNSSQTASITITVLRNEFRPVPSSASLEVTVEEIRAINQSVEIVSFTDADTDVSCDSLFEDNVFFWMG